MALFVIDELPEVEKVTVDSLGIVLTDQLGVPVEVQLLARGILKDVLQRQVLDSQRRGTSLCGVDRQHYESKLYDAHNVKLVAGGRRPVDPIEFRDEVLGDDIVRDDSDTDPRLLTKVFIVSSGREILGSFTLYNIVIEVERDTGYTATAMAMPGCKPAQGFTMRQTWAGIMRWILENDFVVGGRKVDFIEWRFPTRLGHRWFVTESEATEAGGDSETCASVGSRLKAADLEDHDLVEDTDGAPLKIRRRER